MVPSAGTDKRQDLIDLLKLLKKQRVTRDQAAAVLHVNKATISRWRNKKNKLLRSEEFWQEKIEILKAAFTIELAGVSEERGEYGNPTKDQDVNKRLDEMMKRLDALEESNRRIEKALKIDSKGGESSGESIPQGN